MRTEKHMQNQRMYRLVEGFKRIQWPFIALACILLFNLFFTPGFFDISYENGRFVGSLIDMMKRAAPRLIIALGLTLVISTKGIDISVGSIAAIAGSLAVLVIRGGDITYLKTQGISTVPMVAILSTALLAGIVCGAFNGMLVSLIGIQPIIATLILMVAGRGMAMLFTGGYVLNFVHPQYQSLGTGVLLGIPIPIYLAVGMFLLLLWVTQKTPLGLLIQSTGGNQTASRYSGTNITLILFLVYIISGICSAVAGVILTADVQSADAAFIGLWIELEAILAVVIGGTSMNGGRYTLGGTVIGALTIQALITTLLTRAVPVEYTLIFQAIVIFGVLILQSPRVKELSFRRKRTEIQEESSDADA